MFGNIEDFGYLCTRKTNMVPVVQLVRASDCGSECRGFESHRAPQEKSPASCFLAGFLFCLKSTPPILSESSISKTDSPLLTARYFFVITMKNQ